MSTAPPPMQPFPHCAVDVPPEEPPRAGLRSFRSYALTAPGPAVHARRRVHVNHSSRQRSAAVYTNR